MSPSSAHDMSGHDMSAMSSHSTTEMAFLFPDGDDRGWSKIENGIAAQHGAGGSAREVDGRDTG